MKFIMFIFIMALSLKAGVTLDDANLMTCNVVYNKAIKSSSLKWGTHGLWDKKTYDFKVSDYGDALTFKGKKYKYSRYDSGYTIYTTKNRRKFSIHVGSQLEISRNTTAYRVLIKGGIHKLNEKLLCITYYKKGK